MLNNLTYWAVILDSGELLDGKLDDGSWLILNDRVQKENKSITEFKVANIYNTREWLFNYDGYFLGNRIISQMGGNQLELVGFGGYNKTENKVQIEWCHKLYLTVVETETRNAQECGKFLIINPK